MCVQRRWRRWRRSRRRHRTDGHDVWMNNEDWTSVNVCVIRYEFPCHNLPGHQNHRRTVHYRFAGSFALEIDGLIRFYWVHTYVHTAMHGRPTARNRFYCFWLAFNRPNVVVNKRIDAGFLYSIVNPAGRNGTVDRAAVTWKKRQVSAKWTST